MIQGMIGRKVGMTQVFDETGAAFPATVIECGPNVVTQIKTKEKDGYEAVQLGFDARYPIEATRAGSSTRVGLHVQVIFGKSRVRRLTPSRLVRCSKPISFRKEPCVDITGISKGRGFQGGVKRHGFAGGPKTHGQSDRLRAPGSIGSSATPGRVWKGMKMAGRMGNDQVTVMNLNVLKVDASRNLLVIKGSVPGSNNSIVLIRQAVKPDTK